LQEAIDIKLFLENYEKYEGEGDIFDKFGLHFEDELTMWVDKNTIDSLDNPIGEGDIIYFTLADALFEVSFVEREEPFYLLGVQMAYKLKLKKYRHSKEEYFDESGIDDDDIVDIINEESGTETETNESFENEADEIASDDPDDDNSIFGDW
jgi:hypothetical protein